MITEGLYRIRRDGSLPTSTSKSLPMENIETGEVIQMEVVGGDTVEIKKIEEGV